MKKLLLILLSLVKVSAQLTPGTVPVSIPPFPGFTSSLSNSPISIIGGTNVNIVGAGSLNGIVATNSIGFGGTINGIASNVVQRISGLTSDAQTQINAKQNSFTTGTGITNNANILSNNVAAGANITITAGVNGRLTIASTASGTGAPVGTVVSSSTFSAGELLSSLDTTGTNSRPSGLVTNGLGGLNMNQANIGTIIVTNGLTNLLFVGGSISGVTNTDLTASRLMFSDANKRPSSIAIGLGLTNNGSVLSNNIVAGSNVTITGGANGQLTIASSGSGGGVVGTLINTATTAAGQLVQFSDANKTNTTPVTIGLGLTNNASVLSNNIIAGTGITLAADSNGQLTISNSGGGTNGMIVVNTNFISGQVYSNSYGYPIMVISPVTVHVAAVNGNASIELQVPTSTTNKFAISSLLTSISMDYTNQVMASVPVSGLYTITNLSAGAGNTATIPNGGQILYFSGASGGSTSGSTTLFKDNTFISTNTTTTEYSLYTNNTAFPAGTFGTTGIGTITLLGHATNNSAGAANFLCKLWLNGVARCSISISPGNTATSGRDVFYQWTIVEQNVASLQCIHAKASFSGVFVGTTFNTADFMDASGVTPYLTLDTTANISMGITMTIGTSAAGIGFDKHSVRATIQ